MKITFQFTNTTANEYPTLFIDTADMTFLRFKTEESYPDSIRVMQKRDFDLLMDKVRDNGYSPKLGGI